MKRKLPITLINNLMVLFFLVAYIHSGIMNLFITHVSAQVKLKSPDYEIIMYPPVVENDENQKINSGLLDRSEITKLKINGYHVIVSENVVNLSLNSNNISWDDDKEIEEKFLVVSTNSTNNIYISTKDNKDSISEGKLPLFRCMKSRCSKSDVIDSSSPVIAFSNFEENTKNIFERSQVISLSKSSQMVDTNDASIGRLKIFKSKKSIPNAENKLTSIVSIFSRISL